LCAVDRSLIANPMHAIEEVIPTHHETAQDATTECLVDAKAVFQDMKKTLAMRKISDLLEIFNRSIEALLDGYHEG